MRIFTGWRAVGRAMREARRREGVVGPLTAIDNKASAAVFLHWQREDGTLVRLYWPRDGRNRPDLSINFPDRPDGTALFAGMDSIDDAGQVLRVLAALDLVPNYIADAPEERYGRCQVCRKVARLWDDGPGWEPRWVHIQPWAVTGPNAHRAEVAS